MYSDIRQWLCVVLTQKKDKEKRRNSTFSDRAFQLSSHFPPFPFYIIMCSISVSSSFSCVFLYASVLLIPKAFSITTVKLVKAAFVLLTFYLLRTVVSVCCAITKLPLLLPLKVLHYCYVYIMYNFTKTSEYILKLVI